MGRRDGVVISCFHGREQLLVSSNFVAADADDLPALFYYYAKESRMRKHGPDNFGGNGG